MSISADPTPTETEKLASAERHMRRALGSVGGRPGAAGRPQSEPPPPTSQGRSPERSTSDKRSRTRFVQDGEVPITLLNRQGNREPGSLAASPVNRMRTDEALAVEQSAREQAERLLQEALATIQLLQTRQGHAELARQERVDAIQAAQAAAETLHADYQEREARLTDELAAERRAHAATAAALQKASTACHHAEEQLQAALTRKPDPAPAGRAIEDAATGAAKAMPRPASTPRPRKPQPVKWWIKTAKK